MSAMPNIDAHIIEELRFFFAKQDIQVRSIPGGMVNTSHCVCVEQQAYFLKQFASASSIPIKREQAFAHQGKVAELGLAPRPLYLANNNDFQLDTWVMVGALPVCLSTLNEKCQQLAKVLAHLHQLPFSGALLNLRDDWAFYLAHNQQQLSDAEQAELEGLLAYFDSECQAETVLCHNDLAFAHIMQYSPPLLIDWEYSAMSSPYFDVAASITINQLNTEQRALVIKHYAQQRGLDELWVHEKVLKMLAIVRKTNELWARSVGTLAQNSQFLFEK